MEYFEDLNLSLTQKSDKKCRFAEVSYSDLPENRVAGGSPAPTPPKQADPHLNDFLSKKKGSYTPAKNQRDKKA